MKGEFWESEKFRKLLKLIHDPNPPAPEDDRSIGETVLDTMSFGIFDDDGKEDVSQAQKDDNALATAFTFLNVRDPNYWDKKRLRQSLGEPEEGWINDQTRAHGWKWVGEELAKHFYFIDARASGPVLPSVLNRTYCDRVQMDLWEAYDQRIRNSKTFLEKLTCDLENSNYVGVMMDIDCKGDEAEGRRIAEWLADDGNLQRFNTHFNNNAYPELGWDPQCKPFAMRNKAIFKTVPEAIDSFVVISAVIAHFLHF